MATHWRRVFTGWMPSAPPLCSRRRRGSRPISPAASSAASPTRIWRRPRPTSAPAPRSPCSPSPAAACPASPRSGCSIPPPPTTASRAATPSCRSSTTTCRSWSIRSPTSSIAARSPSTCWPIPCWRRGATSTAIFSGFAAEAGERARVRIDDAYRDRPPGRSGAARRARRRADPRAGRGAAGGRGLAGDAARLPRRHRRSRAQPLAQPRRVRGFPALAGGQPFHLPRPSPLSLCRGYRAARRPALRADAGLGARHPAPRRGAAVRGGPGRRRGDGALRARAAATS